MEKSYGIEVAKMLNFPKKIIHQAESYLLLYENQTSCSIPENYKIASKEEKAKSLALDLYKEMEEKLK